MLCRKLVVLAAKRVVVIGTLTTKPSAKREKRCVMVPAMEGNVADTTAVETVGADRHCAIWPFFETVDMSEALPEVTKVLRSKASGTAVST